MSFSCLPIELISDILALALSQHPNPSDILRVNKHFLDICEPILYAHLHFTSTQKLSQFVQRRSRPSITACSFPRTLSVSLAGGAVDLHFFYRLQNVLRTCSSWNHNHGLQVSLDVLSLCLHSHSRDPHLELIYEALSLANPRDFTWSGPDPSHHFSIAIVPAATTYLLRAIPHWSNLRNIKLTNISFPSDERELGGPLFNNAPLLPAIPTLRTVYLGQVTLLPPSAIASMVLSPGTEELRQVKLVDAYKESIWGLRIRRRDVEGAALTIAASSTSFCNRIMPSHCGVLDINSIVARVRDIVSCEAKTERIMGGDRVEGITILE